MKRIRVTVLALALMALCVFIFPAALAQEGIRDASARSMKAAGDYLTSSVTGGLMITGYNGNEQNLVIPSEIDGVSVVAIGTRAFSEKNLISVTIPGSVTSIGESAFFWCRSLKNVTLSSGLKTIGKGAFSYSMLTGITIPGSVTDIGAYAFSSCEDLSSVTLPGGLKVIKQNTFFYCESLGRITIPGTVEEIGEGAFQYCAALTGVVLPGGLKAIGKDAFSECGALTAISIPGGVTDIGDYAFASCDKLASVTLSSGIKTIGNRAFYCAYELTAINIPGTVTAIGEAAFAENTKLSKVTLSDGLRYVGYSAFLNCTALTGVAIPGSVKEIGSSNFTYYYGTYGAFANCTSLASVTLNEGLETICAQAFNGCTALKRIEIPGSVTSIREAAFGGCSALTSAVIPERVAEIREYAFAGTKLTSVTLSEGLEKVGTRAFASCALLKLVSVYSRGLEYGPSVFNGCPADLVLNGYAGSTTETYAVGNGIAFEALSETPLASFGISPNPANPGLKNTVTFSITKASGVSRARLVIDGKILSSDGVPVSGGAAKIKMNFHVSGAYRVSLQVNQGGVWKDSRAGVRTLTIKQALKLGTPVFTNPSGETLRLALGDDASIGWKRGKNAVKYRVAVSNPSDELVYSGETSGTGMTIPSGVFAAAGIYTVEMRAFGNSVQQSDLATCAIDAAVCPNFTMSATTVKPGLNNPVTFTVVNATGASKARIVTDGKIYGAEEAVSGTGGAMIRQAFHASGTHMVSLQVFKNGAWTDGGARAKKLTVKSASRLGVPTLTKPSGGTLYRLQGSAASIAWKGVKNALRYSVTVFAPGGAPMWTSETGERSATIPGSAFNATGAYTVTVVALGNNVQQSKPRALTVRVVANAAFTMSPAATNPGLDTPVTFTVSNAAGATKARMVFDGAETSKEAAVSKKTGKAVILQAFHVSGPRAATVQLFRNGMWEDGGAASQTLTVNAAGKLDTPVLTKPANGALRVALKKSASISWQKVANAGRYQVCVVNADGVTVWNSETAKQSVSIPKSALSRRGVYRAEIYALGRSVQRSNPGAVCIITVY